MSTPGELYDEEYDEEFAQLLAEAAARDDDDDEPEAATDFDAGLTAATGPRADGEGDAESQGGEKGEGDGKGKGKVEGDGKEEGTGEVNDDEADIEDFDGCGGEKRLHLCHECDQLDKVQLVRDLLRPMSPDSAYLATLPSAAPSPIASPTSRDPNDIVLGIHSKLTEHALGSVAGTSTAEEGGGLSASADTTNAPSDADNGTVFTPSGAPGGGGSGTTTYRNPFQYPVPGIDIKDVDCYLAIIKWLKEWPLSFDDDGEPYLGWTSSDGLTGWRAYLMENPYRIGHPDDRYMFRTYWRAFLQEVWQLAFLRCLYQQGDDPDLDD